VFSCVLRSSNNSNNSPSSVDPICFSTHQQQQLLQLEQPTTSSTEPAPAGQLEGGEQQGKVPKKKITPAKQQKQQEPTRHVTSPRQPVNRNLGKSKNKKETRAELLDKVAKLESELHAHRWGDLAGLQQYEEEQDMQHAVEPDINVSDLYPKVSSDVFFPTIDFL
jgi:hypothetical protein